MGVGSNRASGGNTTIFLKQSEVNFLVIFRALHNNTNI